MALGEILHSEKSQALRRETNILNGRGYLSRRKTEGQEGHSDVVAPMCKEPVRHKCGSDGLMFSVALDEGCSQWGQRHGTVGTSQGYSSP